MKGAHSKLVKDHFDIEYNYYDKLIIKLIPKYHTMHKLLVKSLNFKIGFSPKILDLGIGTGQTALTVLKKFPNSKIDGIDLSDKMISEAKIRLKKYFKQIKFIKKDIINLKLKPNSYDGCVAVLSIHHLNEKQKPVLFKKVFSGLKIGGVFVIGDLIKFDTAKETKEKELIWKKFLIKNLGVKEGNYWFDNYLEEDLPSSTPKQSIWLKKAGFKEVKCLWKHMNYAVIVARK